VDVSAVKGNVTISNSYAPISVENVGGTLTVTGRNNALDLKDIEGDLRAQNSYQSVTVNDARGAVSLSSRNSDLWLSFERLPQKDISISHQYGNVRLELPSTASFSVDAETEYGQVETEFEDLDRSTSNRRASLRGRVGTGGPQITIDTRNGNIHLDRRG
jgi:DUF4097 and DUF4098 domain-containing protein YvlB